MQRITEYMKHRQQHILSDRPLPKKVQYTIPKKSEKRKQKEKETGGDDSLQKWFEQRRKEMTGVCMHCGGKTCKDDDKLFKFSIAHILPKGIFESVATHPQNWIELCFWNKSCHTNFDNNILDMMDLNCFDTVIERFKAIYPSIDKKERKKIPDVLKQYIETDL